MSRHFLLVAIAMAVVMLPVLRKRIREPEANTYTYRELSR